MIVEKLGKLIELTKGKKHQETNDPDSKRYIQIEDLNGNENIKYTAEDGVYVQCDDIIIVWDGANAGKVGIGLTGIIGSTLARMVIDKKLTFPKYLFWFLHSKFEFIKSQRTGATIPHVSNSSIQNLIIPLPPLPEQQRIATILDHADTIRRKNREILEKYNQLAQSVFLEMFGDVIRNPKKWQKKQLGNLCEIRRGASPRPINDFYGGSVPWIKIGDGTVGSDIYIESTKDTITEEGAKKSVLLEPGTLIFANCGVSLGFARILKIRGCIHDGWLSLEKINELIINKIYLLKLINSISNYLRKSAPEGTQPNLNTGIMKRFEIPVPPIILQNSFAESIVHIEKQKNLIQTSINKSEKLFESLLQMAFKGEL